MLRHTWRFLSYYRWPFIAGVFVFLAMAYALQPRPMAEYSITVHRPGEPVSYERFSVSPSGRFALICDPWTKRTALIELASSRTIFERTIKDLSECRFDDENGLVFALPGAHDETIECWRWLPGTNSPVKIFERPAYLPRIHFSESQHSSAFKGIAKFEDGMTLSGFLSPDSRIWLIPVRDQKSFHFELVDARTGQHQFNLEPPVSQPDIDSKPVCDVAFSSDSKRVVIQYPLPNEDQREETQAYAMEVHSCETGKRLLHQLLPHKTKLNQLVHFDDKQLLAFTIENDFHFLQQLSWERGYRYSLMKEMVPEPIEQSRDVGNIRETDKMSSALCSIIGTTEGMVIYCWQQYRWPKGVFAGHPAYAPGFYFACRSIETGQLIHSGRLPLRRRGTKDLDSEGWDLLGVLPGHILLLQEPDDGSPEDRMSSEPPQWQQALESWRKRYASWLPSLFRNTARLVCMDAKTGDTKNRLSLEFGSIQPLVACYIPQQQSLYLGQTEEGGFHILQYAFPFRKPWLLILSWSLGIFMVLAGLQFFTQYLRRAVGKTTNPRAGTLPASSTTITTL